MNRRAIRAGCCCLVAAVFIVPALPTMACGPDFSPPVFVQTTKPDASPDAYAGGMLGVVLPTYVQSYQVIAYRYFTGKPLDAEEASQFVALWNKYYGSDNQPSDTSDSSGWDDTLQQWAQKANVDVPSAAQSPQPNGGMAYLSQTYQSYSNCYTDAYATAANTLRARAQEFGADNDAVKSWAKAQVAVFRNCTAPGSTTPEPATSDLPLEISKDRDYQIAAANFYGDDWDNAEKEFLAIAADPSSPWRATAALVAARCQIRKATLGTDDPDARDAIFQAADDQLKKIIADPTLAAVKNGAEQLRGFVEFRSNPEGRALDLSEMLAAGADPASFGQDLDDYTKLMRQADYSFMKDQSLREKSDMTDWIVSYRNNPSSEIELHAISRWQQTHSLAWLVAALANAQSGTPQLPALLKAAAAVPQNSPAYLTVAFQRDRLLGNTGEAAQARRDFNRVLSMPTGAMSLSSRNLFLALRMKVAANVNEFLRYAPRTEAEPATNFWGQAGAGTDQQMFDDDAAQAFTQQMPLDVLVASVESTTLPQTLRSQVATAAWTRAVLLHNDSAARRLAPLVVNLAPEMKDQFAPYLAARTTEDREFAAVLILLHTPAFEPIVLTGLGRFGPDGQESPLETSSYGGNWWCSLAPSRPGSGYFNQGYRPGLDGVLSQLGQASAPDFLTTEEKNTATKEWGALLTLPSGPDWLIEQTLAWAKTHPQDARVPEALYLGVHATRHGCSDAGTGALSKQAFEMLRRRYPNSEWTKQTPYWFN